MTKTIIHITTFLQGGAGKLICDLISHQLMLGYRVICLCNDKDYPGYLNYAEYEQRLRDLNVVFIQLPGLFKREAQEQQQAVQTLATLLSQQPDNDTIRLVHAHAAIPADVAMQVREQLDLSFPVIATMHGWGTNKTEPQEQQDIRILSRLDAVVAVSESAGELLLKKGLRQPNLCVIYNGVAQAQKEQAEPTLPGHWFSKDESVFKIVCLGSICERKNQLLLIEAIAQLRSNGLNFVCVLIGELDSTYAQQLESFIQAQDLGHCLILNGPLANADRYLGYFDIMVLPTRAEGMPMAILEAFREQTLVLSSDIGECRELIEDGVHGFLFESENVQSLVSKLRMIRQLNPAQRKAIVKRAYQRLLRSYTQEAVFRAYDQLYRKLSAESEVGPD